MNGSYTCRYLPGTDMRDRKHKATLPKFSDFGDAEDYRLSLPNAHLLEVVQRFGGGEGR